MSLLRIHLLVHVVSALFEKKRLLLLIHLALHVFTAR